MVQRRIFLDANVIIESFRISVWAELSNGHRLETVEMCEREALTGQTTSYDRVVVDSVALRAGLKASHIVAGRSAMSLLVRTEPA